jgi:acetylornithine deacetylase/succinyl-diaminopimelate desuccinylase-like protein
MQQSAAEWLSRLVRLPSVSPAHASPKAGVTGEARIAAEVAGWFREFGGEVHLHEVEPGRPNVYGVWRGRSDGWMGLDVHMDTVGVEQMPGDPFSGEVRDGRVYGRGAVDTKASLAIALSLLQRGRTPRANLLVAATVDEEDGARGAPAFAEWLRARGLKLDQLAVAEPTRCAPIVGHKGVLRLAFEIHGVPAHSSQPDQGKNAITAAAHLAVALDEEHHRLRAEPYATAAGPPALTVTLIRGGVGANVVPDSCTVTIDRRMVPGEEGDTVAANLEALAHEASPLPFTLHAIKKIQPFAQSPDAPWVRQLAEWSGQIPAYAPYCTNAWAYHGVAAECVVIGPGSIDQAHGEEEWVEISELDRLSAIYARWWGFDG